MDNGAKCVMFLAEGKRDFTDIPGDLLGKRRTIFCSDPTATLRAIGLE